MSHCVEVRRQPPRHGEWRRELDERHRAVVARVSVLQRPLFLPFVGRRLSVGCECRCKSLNLRFRIPFSLFLNIFEHGLPQEQR